MGKQLIYVSLISGIITLLVGLILYITGETSYGSGTGNMGQVQNGGLDSNRAFLLGIGMLIFAIIAYYWNKNEIKRRNNL